MKKTIDYPITSDFSGGTPLQLPVGKYMIANLVPVPSQTLKHKTRETLDRQALDTIKQHKHNKP